MSMCEYVVPRMNVGEDSWFLGISSIGFVISRKTSAFWQKFGELKLG